MSNKTVISIEEKLDQIISILLRIEESVSGGISKPLATPVEEKINDTPIKKAKPTKSQLEFQKHIFFSLDMQKGMFFSAIRKGATELMKKKELDPSCKLKFNSLNIMSAVEDKITKTSAQFYRDLKEQTNRVIKAIEFEGEKVLERAIGRITARVK